MYLNTRFIIIDKFEFFDYQCLINTDKKFDYFNPKTLKYRIIV
jgi:hypothetical protein